MGTKPDKYVKYTPDERLVLGVYREIDDVIKMNWRNTGEKVLSLLVKRVAISAAVRKFLSLYPKLTF